MAKLRGTLITDKGQVSRNSSSAVHSTLSLIHTPGTVSAFTTVDEGGGVSLRIELAGRVLVSEHWPLSELVSTLTSRKA